MNKKIINIVIPIIVLVCGVLIGAIIGAVFLLPNVNVAKQEGAVPDLSEQCSFACESGQKYAFCDVKRKVTDELKLTCDALSKDSKYNVKTCPTISC